MVSKDARPDGKPIQMKLPVVRHKEMKAYAAERGISMIDMFLKGYQIFRKTRGG